MEKYLTVEEVAKYLSYAEKTIYKWVLNEEIPYIKINQTIRFRLSDIECWLEKNKKGVVVENKKASGFLFPAGDAGAAGGEEVKQDLTSDASGAADG